MFGSSGRSRRSRGRRSSSDDGAGMKPSVSERAITEMFKSYAEEDDPTIIGMDGAFFRSGGPVCFILHHHV